jgi:NADPH-dependent 2,4-dienoyl-CoA reductase/sulfur reductase-like enzyme
VKRIAVVGASLAGLSAARALRTQGFDGEVTVIGEEVHRPYDRPPLSKEFLLGQMEHDDLALETDDEAALHWVLGRRAVRLDSGAAEIVLDDDSRIGADGVVIATGARARRFPGRELGGVHVLRTLDDARALRSALVPDARLAVIGAGFIGAEVASTARKLGLDVTVIEAATVPLAGPVGPALGEALAGLHAIGGVTLLCGTGVAELTGVGQVTGVSLVDGRHVPADVVVVGIGAIPNVEWLRGASVAVENGVRCDARGATSVPEVVAVGDCASWFDPTVGRQHRVEHWTGALERPAIAVATLLSGGALELGCAKPPYFWSDQYGKRIQFAGYSQLADEVTVEIGSVENLDFLAVYRRAGEPVAALGVNQPRAFTRIRRQLGSLSA